MLKCTVALFRLEGVNESTESLQSDDVFEIIKINLNVAQLLQTSHRSDTELITVCVCVCREAGVCVTTVKQRRRGYNWKPESCDTH